MKLRDEMQNAVFRLFGKHVSMQDCHDLGALTADIDEEVDRLMIVIMELLKK